MSKNSLFEENLPKNQANYSPLTPLSFLTRTAEVFPERTAVIHGEIKRSWRETLKRCSRMASAAVRLDEKSPLTLLILLKKYN